MEHVVLVVNDINTNINNEFNIHKKKKTTLTRNVLTCLEAGASNPA